MEIDKGREDSPMPRNVSEQMHKLKSRKIHLNLKEFDETFIIKF